MSDHTVYHMETSNEYNAMMRGFFVKDGVITASWTFQKLGNGGLLNDENAAIPYIGKKISDYPQAHKVADER